MHCAFKSNYLAFYIDTELHKLAQEVIDLIKEVIGKELFAEKYSKLQRKVSEKKEKRKRKNAEEVSVVCFSNGLFKKTSLLHTLFAYND